MAEMIAGLFVAGVISFMIYMIADISATLCKLLDEVRKLNETLKNKNDNETI